MQSVIRTNASRTMASSMRSARVARRNFAAEAGKPENAHVPNPPSPASSSNTPLLAVLGVAAAAGGYYFYTRPDERTRLEQKAQAENDELKKRASIAASKIGDAKDIAKDRAGTLYKQSEIAYNDAKKATDAGLKDAGAKYDQLKSDATPYIESAKDKAVAAKDVAQTKYAETREATEQLYKEARAKADQKEYEAKKGWFSWLNWGQAKKEEAARVAATEADRVKAELERRSV